MPAYSSYSGLQDVGNCCIHISDMSALVLPETTDIYNVLQAAPLLLKYASVVMTSGVNLSFI